MVGRLERVLVCPPENAGWNSGRAAAWRELGFLHAPEFAVASEQHATLCHELESAGAEVVRLPASGELTLDAVYTHDPSIVTDFGAIPFVPGKANRVAEGSAHATFYRVQKIPVLGEVHAPGSAEGGDMVWLDARTLLIGRGCRTNSSGISQMRTLLKPLGIEVLPAPLPYSAGPSTCLHLMSLMSLLDDRTVLVDLPWLAVETVELLHARGYRMVEIEYEERETLACNVLSLGEGRLLALAENARTNEKLAGAGFDMRVFPGSALCINGGGGPTCLTRPLARR
jgi:N-dimethylarginine dimethylaminohydrolase